MRALGVDLHVCRSLLNKHEFSLSPIITSIQQLIEHRVHRLLRDRVKTFDTSLNGNFSFRWCRGQLSYFCFVQSGTISTRHHVLSFVWVREKGSESYRLVGCQSCKGKLSFSGVSNFRHCGRCMPLHFCCAPWRDQNLVSVQFYSLVNSVDFVVFQKRPECSLSTIL